MSDNEKKCDNADGERSWSERRKDIAIYKPNKKITGGVAQFKLGNRDDCMFLEIAKQTDAMDSSKPYDWENTKIIVKLGIPDITKMMAYFRMNNPTSPLKLFHKSNRGTKTIELKWQESFGNYYLSISSKEHNVLKRAALPIGLDEVELLMVGFARALEIILKW